MKISSLIKRLQDTIDEYGDLDVLQGAGGDIDVVRLVSSDNLTWVELSELEISNT